MTSVRNRRLLLLKTAEQTDGDYQEHFSRKSLRAS